jgi:hypothetical protein
VIALICPECPDNGDTGLRHDSQDRNIYNCPRCLCSFVHSISRAAPHTVTVNTAAPFYQLVLDVDALFNNALRNRKQKAA